MRPGSRLKRILLLACLWAIAAAIWFAFYTYPWSWLIDQRVSKIGADLMTAEFDEWSKMENPPRRVRLESLPPNLASLNPIRVFKKEEGLFLVLKERLADETGIFIAKEKSPWPAHDSDPSFVKLGPRIYRYRVKG